MILVLFILLFAGCKKKITQEDLIKSAVDLKLGQWREDQMKACKDKAMMKAEKYVDSLLVATSLETKLDTIPKPEKPAKPPKPSFKTKPDSVVVEKIYKKGDQ
jgi:hypothetical protein